MASDLVLRMVLKADGSALIDGVRKSREEINQFLDRAVGASEKTKALGTAQAQAAAGAKAAADATKQLATETTQTNTALSNIQKTVLGVGNYFLSTGQKIAGLVIPTNAFEKIAAILGAMSVVKFGENFTTEVSKIKVITGASGKDLDNLKDKALEIGNVMSKSGADVASAFTVMGSVRPELLKNIEALSSTTKEAIALTKAASAMGVELSDAQSATILGESLSQFGEKANQASRYVNVLAASAKAGSSLIADTSDALKNAGVELSSANLSFEEANAVVQLLAEIGIKGSEAGTKIRGVFAALADPSKIEKLGLNFAEVNPRIVGVEQAFLNLKNAGLSTAEMLEIFQERNKNAAVHLIQNIDNLKGYTQTIKSGTTAAYDASAEKAKTLGMVMSGLETRFKNISSALYGYVEPSIAKVLSGLIKFTSTGANAIGVVVNDVNVLGDSFSKLSTQSLEVQATVFAMGETLRSLEPLAKVAGVGGLLWAGFAFGPTLIAGTGTAVVGFGAITTGVTNAIGMAFLKLTANATVSATTTGAAWSLANTALWGTSLSAQAAAGAMAQLQIAGSAIFAAWMGYELGAWAWNEFETVRKAGYALVGGLQQAWIDIQIGWESALGFIGKGAQRIVTFFEDPLRFVEMLWYKLNQFISKSFASLVDLLSAGASKLDFLPGMADATGKLTVASQFLQTSAKKFENAANESVYTKNASSKDKEIEDSVNARIALLNKEKDAIIESQDALMNATGNYSKANVGQSEVEKQFTKMAESATNAGKAVESTGKKVENSGISITDAKMAVFDFNQEILKLTAGNDITQKLNEIVKKTQIDIITGNTAITKEKAKQQVEEVTFAAQNLYLLQQGVEIGKERLEVLQDGNILKSFQDQYDRITFLTEAQREYLVAEKASIEVLKLKNEIQNTISKSGLSEEQARVNDLMQKYSGIISETTAKNIASIEKQAKGYGELRGAYDKLQVASIISEQNELITLSQKYGEEIAKQVFQINNLAKARQDAQNAQRDIQTAGLTGVQKDIATTAIKYGGDVEAAKEVVALQRQKSALEELVAARKELANSTLTADQQKYLDLAEKIGASAAKESIQMRNLAESRKAGVAELQKSMEELSTLNLSDKAKGYFEVIKNVSPEYREQIIALKQQTEEIQKQSGFYNEIANKVADQFALIATGQKSVSQGWKDMANDVGSMLQKVATDQMKNQIMQLFGANNPQQDAMAAIKAAQNADAERAKQFQVSIQEVDLSVKKTIEERSIDATSKMGATIDDGVKKLQSGLETALSNLNQSMPKAIESFGKQMADAISGIKIGSQQDQMLKAQMAGFDAPKSTSQKYDFSQSQNQVVSRLAQIAEQQGVAAEDLIRFAKIESNFNANAFNKGSKAAGMFQFIPSTAKAYGIRGNEFDMEANTLAAIKLWKDNARMLEGYVDNLNGAMAYLAHQQGAGGAKDILRAAQGDSFHLSSTRRNINANVAGDIEKYTGVSKSQFQAMDDSNMAKTFVDYWQKKFDAIPLDKYGAAMGEATVATKATATVQNEQTQAISQNKTVQQEASLTQTQMLDQQNAAFLESSQSALKTAESVGVLGLNSMKGSDLIASGAQLAAAKIMNIADARVAAIYNMKATGADQETIQSILNSNSKGNASGFMGVVTGSQQDQMLADQMAGFDTSATGFFSDFSSSMKGVVSDVTGWIGTAKGTISGWTDSLGLTGSGGLFGGGESLLGGAAQWAGVAGSLLKGDIKGAVSSGISVGANMLGTAIAGPIGGLVAGFAANALTGLVMGGGETRSGGAYRVNEKGNFNKIQGPSGGDIGLDNVTTAMKGTVTEINKLFEKLGSKEKVTDFTGALETSDKGRGGVWAGGQLASGKTFGEQFKGQNVFESQTSRTLNKDEAVKAFALDLKQATLQAIQSASDIPKYISNLLKDIDIEALGEEKINQMLGTIDAIQSMQGAFENLGISMDSITPSLIESAGGIEQFKNEMAVFSDKFVGEQNKAFVALNSATDQISNSLKDMGLVIPTTRDGFTDMVKGLDLTSEAGQKTFGSLMKLVPAFDQLYAQQESAINQYFEAFGTPVEKAAKNQESLNKQFTQFGLQVPKSEAEFQALAQQLYAGDQNAKNQAVALMQLYPQWKANETAQIQAGNSLLGFTVNLKAMAGLITEQTVNQNLTKAVTDAKSPQEAGDAFAAAMMQSIQQAMVGTLIQSISQAVMTGLVQPMMTGASNAAMMQAQGGSIAGMNMAQGGAMSATAQSQGGAIAATSVATGGANAANAMATGGAAAANAMAAGGESVADRVQTVIAQAREMMSTMTAVMKDPEMQTAMSEMMDGFKTIGAETYTAVGTINQSFAQFTPAATTFSNEVSNAGSSASEAGEKAAEAAVDFTKFKDSLKDFSTGLEGDDLKMSKIATAFKDVDLSSLGLSGSLENMAGQIANSPNDKLTEIASEAKLSVDDMQSYVLDFFNISRQRAKDAAEKAKEEAKALSESFKSLQSGINPQTKIEELAGKYGVNPIEAANQDAGTYFSELSKLTESDLKAAAAQFNVPVEQLVQDALDYGNALKENEQKFKDFTKSLSDFSVIDETQQSITDLGNKYGEAGKAVLSGTLTDYLKFAQSLKPEDMRAIAATYGISIEELQTDLLDAGSALRALGETARDKAVEDFKVAMDAIDGSLNSVKTSIENINPQSAEQILEKTKKEWQEIILSGQNIDKLSDATDKYQNAIEEVRQKQLQAIEDYRAGINKAIEDSQSFKKTLESDIFNLRKTLGKSGTSNADQMGLVQKQLAGISGKSQADLEKQTELQGRLKDLILGNLDDQINAQQKAFDAQQEVFDAQKQQFETQLDNSKALIEFAKDLKGFVDDLMLGDTSILTNEQRVNESQRQYQELLSKAKSGDQDAIKGLSNAASTYLKEARTYYASSDAYTGIFKDVTSTVSSLAGSLETQGSSGVSSAQSGLNGLTATTSKGEMDVSALQEAALTQLMALETARQQTETDLKTLLTQPPPQAIEQTQFDSVIATVNDAALAQLDGVQSSLQTLENSTIQAFGTNINQLSSNIGMNAGQIVGSIQGMQADFGGRLSAIVGVVQQAQADAAAAQAQAAALQAQQDALNSGTYQIKLTDQSANLPSYDVGTPYVEGDQVAQIHDGEMVIDKRSSEVLRNYGIPIQQPVSQNNNGDSEKQIKLLEENNQQLSQIIQVLLALLNENEQQSENLVVLNEILPQKLGRSIERLKKTGARS